MTAEKLIDQARNVYLRGLLRFWKVDPCRRAAALAAGVEVRPWAGPAPASYRQAVTAGLVASAAKAPFHGQPYVLTAAGAAEIERQLVEREAAAS